MGGRNENIWTKIEQLEFHQQMHKLYQQGLVQRDLFSHYLLLTETYRKWWLAQLEYIVNFEDNKVSTEKKIRDKVPKREIGKKSSRYKYVGR